MKLGCKIVSSLFGLGKFLIGRGKCLFIPYILFLLFVFHGTQVRLLFLRGGETFPSVHLGVDDLFDLFPRVGTECYPTAYQRWGGIALNGQEKDEDNNQRYPKF